MRTFCYKLSLPAALSLLLTAVLTVAAVPAAGQSTTEGAIAGTVFDTSGAVIPSAAVVLRNNGTNETINLTSDSSGYFKAPLVPAGAYTVTITAAGFGTYTANQVAVTVGSLTELQPVMKTGTASEMVTVTGEAPVLKMESPEISETLTVERDSKSATERRALVGSGSADARCSFRLQRFRTYFLPRDQPAAEQRRDRRRGRQPGLLFGRARANPRGIFNVANRHRRVPGQHRRVFR